MTEPGDRHAPVSVIAMAELRNQLLDLAIARLKAALPPGTDAPPVRSLNVPLVAVGLPGGRS